MFEDVQYEHHWSHDTHQSDRPILAKRVPALHCQWLCYFCYSCLQLIHVSRNRGHVDQSFHKSPTKRNPVVWDLKKSRGVRSGWAKGTNNRSCCNHWQCNAGTRLARIGLTAWCVSCDQWYSYWTSLNIPRKNWDYKLSEFTRCVFIYLIVSEIFIVKMCPRLLKHPVFENSFFVVQNLRIAFTKAGFILVLVIP